MPIAPSSPKCFFFGYGYVAQRLATHLRKQGFALAGTSRDEEKIGRMEHAGIEAFQSEQEYVLYHAAEALAGTTHIVVSIPPDAEGDVILRWCRNEIAMLPDIEWIGYLSTTGVYGDYKGEWVSEDSACHPEELRSIQRLEAEKGWLKLAEAFQLPVHIFRLAGIYGPQRNALEQVRKGAAKRIDAPGQVFSRIHVDDIVRVLLASMEKPNPQAVYNVADDYPCAQSDVIAYACELLEAEVPPLIPLQDADLSDIGKSFYMSCRRVQNEKIKRELALNLLYPSYKEGLCALKDEMNP